MADSSRRLLSGVSVDDEGVLFSATQDVVVDVTFDERRVASYWLLRDSVEANGADDAARRYVWPIALRRFLNGSTRLGLVEHTSGEEQWSEEVTLGSGEGRILVQDAQGNPMGLDKSDRMTRLFGERTSEQVQPLLDSMQTVLDALEAAGVRPFLAYGTLLGAVREGGLLGHDSDADLGYVSDHDHPVPVMLESFALQRRLHEMGFEVTRYSGLAFKVLVPESDGTIRGLDVFGGFLRDGVLYLMGEIGHPFERDWLEPRGTASLEGRDYPVPADPGRLLEAMYGASWRVPDPAFHFETPESAVRRLNGWFRGTRVGLTTRWARHHKQPDDPDAPPSDFVAWVHEQEPDAMTVVDVGCGTGRDAVWISRRLRDRGGQAWGLDFFSRGYLPLAKRAARKGLPVTFRWTNLSEFRSIAVTGAELSRAPGPRVVLARHVADATDRQGRDNLLRLARMIAGPQGRFYTEFHTEAGPERAPGTSPLDLDAFLEQVAARGGTVQSLAHPTPGSVRLVISW